MECERARRCGIDESLKKITAVLSSFILSILPFLILWAAWSVLPDTIPAHWSGGVVDRWGNKLELLVVPLFSLIGSIAISVYLIVSTRRREFADFSVRMRRDFVACYISSLLLSTTCSVIIAVWVQLILTQSTAVDGGAWTIDPVFPSRAICDLVRFAAFLCERREQKGRAPDNSSYWLRGDCSLWNST